MKDIINPIAKEVLEAELTKDKFVRNTNYGNNELYIFSAHDSPNLMLEIGRLRELTFRLAGGGTGKEVDIDSYDTAEIPYKQLVVWDPEDKELLGGYRFIYLDNPPKDKDGNLQLATKGLFEFSDEFINDYLPTTIELGRSFIQPNFQSKNASRKALFALDNLWDGLGALVVENPKMQYFFGKVTMYTHFEKFARDLILYFMNTQFIDEKKLVYPVNPLKYHNDTNELAKIFTENNYKDNYKILSKEVRSRNENIPPLINTYMNLSPTMKCFGTSINDHFGEVEETGILITIPDIYEKKKERHLVYDMPEHRKTLLNS